MSRRYLFSLYILSGGLLGLASLVSFGWLLVVTGLGMLLWVVEQTERRTDLLMGAGLAFLIKSLTVTSVFYSIYPLDWLPVTSGVALLMVGAYWFYSAIGASVAGLIMVQAWPYLFQLRRFYQVILFPVGWVAGEVLGAFFYSLLMSGEGIGMTLMPSAGFVGHALAYHAGLFGFAAWGGVYSLSFLVVVLALVFKWLFQLTSLNSRLIALTLAMLAFTLSSGLIWPSAPQAALPKIAIIETDFSVSFMADNQTVLLKEQAEHLFTAVTEALKWQPDFIILPEDARFISGQLTPAEALGFYQLALSGPTSVLIDSARTLSLGGEGAYLRASVYEPTSATVWQVDKQSLIPFGEYLPLALAKILSLIGGEAERQRAETRLSYRPGSQLAQADWPNRLPGILFCFESFDPWAARRLAYERELPFIAHLVSHAWFNNPAPLRRLVEAPLLTQARFSGVPIVSAANSSVSQIYWPNGQVDTPQVVAEGESWRVRLITPEGR